MSEPQKGTVVAVGAAGYAAAGCVTFGAWLSIGPPSMMLGLFWPATRLTYLGWWLVN